MKWRAVRLCINEPDPSFPLLMSHITEIWLYREQMATAQTIKQSETRQSYSDFTSRVSSSTYAQRVGGWSFIKDLRGVQHRVRPEVTKKQQDISVGRGRHMTTTQEMSITSPPPYTLIICKCAVPRFDIKLFALWTPTDLVSGHKCRPLRKA